MHLWTLFEKRDPGPQLHRFWPEATEKKARPCRKPQSTTRLLVAGPRPSFTNNLSPCHM